jgi:hypothetical protein
VYVCVHLLRQTDSADIWVRASERPEPNSMGGCGRVWEGVGGCGRVWEGVGGCGRMWEMFGDDVDGELGIIVNAVV